MTDTGRTCATFRRSCSCVSLPVGAIAYNLTVQVITALSGRSADVLTLLAALFVAGLVMLPFLIPFFDRKAKQDLAAYRSQHPDVDVDPPTPADGEDRPT